MQQKTFYDQPYLTALTTNIKEVVKKDGKFHIVLEETIFCPEGGGQPADGGLINDVQVLSVYEENNVIFHVVAEELRGTEAVCRLDFDRRLYHMHQHTGQHLLSALFENHHHIETKSFHLGEDYATIDLDRPNLGNNLMNQVEDAANDFIRQNLPIKIYMVTKEEVKNIPVRKPPTVDENIRIVEIEKIDYSPCCGTHLRSTAELGLLKIIKSENIKQMTRVYFLCGKKAMQDYRNKHALLSELYVKLGANENSVAGRVQGLLDGSKESGKEMKRLKEELFKYKASDIAKASDKKTIVMHFEDYKFEDIQLLAQNITALGDYIVVLSAGKDKKLLIAHSGKAAVDCGRLIKENIAKHNGRGGGSPKFAQGSFEKPEDMASFREYLAKNIDAR